ncbi:DUF4189 domain-containing protein [Winogradskyella immobilis]|uniref:DUF4189 domain-containing protein n=1 Tax=Winogradskyella immobilis TaxID=2816852 RepID=A0ABS8EJP3_9FLAO|nr:DUF4189 domain-containing protein [Winogradskyella immobilis]MCC1483428.1 DUF4189 domain-containing protein [Winogradskyella immobilis]MCG0015522.1 DUF4189 domain-containing protein [Winogradskyella immobilis]
MSNLFLATAQEGNYGSLAIDQRNGDQYGWAINYNSQSEANKRAISECEKNGGDNCHTVMWFKGGCAAYVVQRGNPNIYGWGLANTREEAEQIALDEARARGGFDLAVRVWGCNATKNSDYGLPPLTTNGVYGFYYFKDKSANKAYFSKVFYQPNVVKKQSDNWTWSDYAETRMTYRAKKFRIACINDIMGFEVSKETLDTILQKETLDWEGYTELYINKKFINRDIQTERKAVFDKVYEGFKKRVQNENEGIEIVEVSIPL